MLIHVYLYVHIHICIYLHLHIHTNMHLHIPAKKKKKREWGVFLSTVASIAPISRYCNSHRGDGFDFVFRMCSITGENWLERHWLSGCKRGLVPFCLKSRYTGKRKRWSAHWLVLGWPTFIYKASSHRAVVHYRLVLLLVIFSVACHILCCSLRSRRHAPSIYTICICIYISTQRHIYMYRCTYTSTHRHRRPPEAPRRSCWK